MWAQAGGLPLLLDDGGHRYLHGNGITPYAQVATDGTIECLHTGALGSVRTITDAADTVVATNTFGCGVTLVPTLTLLVDLTHQRH
ncbi:hypothetical protein ACFO1B_24135 [Dactylosporangium siamense]|uniref:Uncharacterized protein n=1 Tax=Dactylosporangium siamense TaxID=685454 RepID=A0A919U9U5_9ACTN|nr:hypothetical protein [Dactylosporangium siamense]GIG47292.1 hypothetical protein Dsi01nite_053330 [Dactylosporangium siamense]